MKHTYKLFMGFVLGGLLFSAANTYSQCIDANWQYSNTITVTNPTAADMHNYQTLITVNTATLVSAGKLQASGADLRFYQNGCCNLLCFSVESGINTATTKIWVKVPFIAAGGTSTLNMAYGNPSATDAQSASCTFDMWEPFDNAGNHFTADPCGSGSYAVSGGQANISWGANYILTSDVNFDMDTVYTTEANVTAASGNWPGVYWMKNSGTNAGYGMLLGGGNVRISKSGSSTGYCQGHNWASGLLTYGSVTGIWSVAWPATGVQSGVFPSTGLITSTDTEHSRDTDMKVTLGGISSGSGSMSVDWVRVRKYSATEPTASLGTETGLSFMAVSLPNDTSFCQGGSMVLDAGSGFTSYSWSTSATSQSINVNASGTYSVTAIDAATCPSTDSVTITVLPNPVVDLGPDFSICSGDSTLLDAGAGSSYAWSNSATTQTVNVPPGTYNVLVTAVGGCTDRDTIVIGSAPAPTASFMQILSGLTVNFNNTSTGGSTYSWDFGDGDTSNFMSPVHTFDAPGTYNVCLTVTNVGGCETTVCMNVTVTSTGIPTNFDAAGIRMFPNPAEEICWIQLPAGMEHAAVTLFDISGKMIFTTQDNKSGTVKIDLETLSAGMYQVRIVNGNDHYTSKLLVK